ncbi:hypothetical protein ISS86_00940 [Candidatus Microgenomates bacterium]|nr:hypothetical protein [Candidatus Microgenomates bacterium]
MNEPKEVAVAFPKTESGFERVVLPLSEFVDRNQPTPFTLEDEKRLCIDFGELKETGVHGVVHIVNQLTESGLMIARAMPPSLINEGHYVQVHYVPDRDLKRVSKGPFGGYLEEYPERMIVVTTPEEGKAYLEKSEKEKLERLLSVPRVGVIIGGGRGVAGKDLFAPLMMTIEEPLKQGTPMAGICLGFQEFAKMLDWRLTGKRYWEIGSQVETVTEQGKLHPVFMPLGDAFVAVASNKWLVAFSEGLGDSFEFGKVLARGSRKQPTGLALKFEEDQQVVGIQRHPEWGMKGESKKEVVVQLKDDGKVKLPAGLSPDMIYLIQNLIAPHFKTWQENYGLTADDVRDMVLPERLPQNIGKEFYGWLLQFFADFRLKTYESKS